jgi:hypothetical protein
MRTKFLTLAILLLLSGSLALIVWRLLESNHAYRRRLNDLAQMHADAMKGAAWVSKSDGR